MIPFPSIANGLAFGITAYALLRLLRGRIGWADWLLLVLSARFVARLVWLSDSRRGSGLAWRVSVSRELTNWRQ